MKRTAFAKPMGLTVGMLLLFSFGLVMKGKYRFASNPDYNAVLKFLNTLEDAWYDFKFRTRHVERTSDVFVAKIDDASLERFGRWPWPRSTYAAILDYLYELGADTVAFDAVFSEPEFQQRHIREMFRTPVDGRPQPLADEAKLTPEQQELLVDVMPRIGVQVFGAAVKRYPKTVLGYIWQRDSTECPLYDPLNPEHVRDAKAKGYSVDDGVEETSKSQSLRNPVYAREQGVLHVEHFIDSLAQLNQQAIVAEGFPPLVFDPVKPTTPIEVFRCPIVNRSEINAYAKHQAYFNNMADHDGLFRRQLMVVGFQTDFVPEAHRDFLEPAWFKNATFFPSLALKAVAAHWDSPGIRLDLAREGTSSRLRAVIVDRKDGPPVRIETLPDGSMPINFYGKQTNFNPPIPEFSLGTIEPDLKDPRLKGRVSDDPTRPLLGKIVLIGPTAQGVYDLRPNPVDGGAAGVFLHATTAARILEAAHDPAAHMAVRFPTTGVSLAILWGLGLALGAILSRVQALQGALASIVVMGGYLFVDDRLFSTRALALDGMTTALGLMNVFLAVFAYKYFTEEKDRAFVKGAFEKYVSPDVVASIMDDPRKLNLGGQKKELTVMFSDVRGFTTISERMGAAELATFMNNYLTPMTEIVIENRGTIDKYMGDAIMAIFGAPVAYDEHPAKAVDAGLQMLEKLDRDLKPAWRAQGLPEVDIGIGVNTGDMSVGNMGSNRIFAYTVMGDAVNLGSRIEGINKEYKTRLIVSEFTRKYLGPDYVCRELDRVKVKGKVLPVTIFEVMAKGPGHDHLRLRAQKFEAALALYYAQKFLEAEALFRGLEAEDPTSGIYVERCVEWRAEPPGADWDGSWTMKSK